MEAAKLKKLGLTALKNKAMPKQMKVEASIQTKGRFRDGSGKYVFVIYDQFTNETLHESNVYTQRSNAKRGGLRYAKREKMKIVLWVK
jgi:hypothetical protein